MMWPLITLNLVLSLFVIGVEAALFGHAALATRHDRRKRARHLARRTASSRAARPITAEG